MTAFVSRLLWLVVSRRVVLRKLSNNNTGTTEVDDNDDDEESSNNYDIYHKHGKGKYIWSLILGKIINATIDIQKTSNHHLEGSGETRHPQEHVGDLYSPVSRKRPEVYRIPESFDNKFHSTKNS